MALPLSGLCYYNLSGLLLISVVLFFCVSSLLVLRPLLGGHHLNSGTSHSGGPYSDNFHDSCLIDHQSCDDQQKVIDLQSYVYRFVIECPSYSNHVDMIDGA